MIMVFLRRRLLLNLYPHLNRRLELNLHQSTLNLEQESYKKSRSLVLDLFISWDRMIQAFDFYKIIEDLKAGDKVYADTQFPNSNDSISKNPK